jgi:hypothetical protein
VSCVYSVTARPERDASTTGGCTTLIDGEQASQPAPIPPTLDISDVSPIAEPTTAESKIEQLETRVIALERVVSHMAELTKHVRHSDQYVNHMLDACAKLNCSP